MILHIENDTPFAAEAMWLPGSKNEDTLFVVVKATFVTRDDVDLAPAQEAIVLADTHTGEPGASSLELASEAHMAKASTDIVLVAEAASPGERPSPSVDVGIRVGGRTKVARVFGERVWRPGALSPSPGSPKPFVRMPLVYERAYGGTHVVDAEAGKVFAEDRNPVGRGFLGKRGARQLIGQPLPNIEDPSSLLRSPGDKVAPVGFGPVAPSWQPRLQYGGTYDEEWIRTRAPLLPLDFDPRFVQVAQPDMQVSPPLVGGEPVVLLNLTPRGKESFKLPVCTLSVEIDVGAGPVPCTAMLETVWLKPADDLLCVTWRAASACTREALRAAQVSVSLLDMKLS